MIRASLEDSHEASSENNHEADPKDSGVTRAFIVSQRELCWLAFIAATVGFLLGRWIP